MQVACAEKPEWNSGEIKGYLLTDSQSEKNIIKILISPAPLKAAHASLDMIQYAVAKNSTGMNSTEIQKLLKHRATISLTPIYGNDHPAKQAEFVAKVLGAVSQLPDAIGCVNIEAQQYLPKHILAPIFSTSKLNNLALNLLLVQTETIEDNRGINTHTHGLGQFNSPDIEFIAADKDTNKYFTDLLRKVSVQVMSTGKPVNELGVIKADADGALYQVTKKYYSNSTHFGQFGVLDLERQ
jgi:hypothetical protein